MKTDPNAPATAQVVTSMYNANRHFGGLSVRELFAAMAMQSLSEAEQPEEAAANAVQYADALIAALNEEREIV